MSFDGYKLWYLDTFGAYVIRQDSYIYTKTVERDLIWIPSVPMLFGKVLKKVRCFFTRAPRGGVFFHFFTFSPLQRFLYVTHRESGMHTYKNLGMITGEWNQLS